MKPFYKRTLATMAVSAALAAPAAHATNGYFKIGYGSHNRGVAGAGAAFTQDSMAGVSNPAGLVDVGNRVDGGLELFNPKRKGKLDAQPLCDATGVPANCHSKERSGATLFAIPHLGFAMKKSNKFSYGLSLAANGGMNTRYNDNIYANSLGPAVGWTPNTDPTGGGMGMGFAGAIDAFTPANIPDAPNDPIPGDPFGFGATDHAIFDLGMDGNVSSTLGVNLAQLIIAPTMAYSLTENHSVGASLQIGYQRFRAYGLGLFKPLSSSPDEVSNNGDDDSWGAGVRVGYQGKITDWLTVGAAYASKIYMEEFDDYAGLFAEQGDFDIPANYTLGFALTPTDKLTVAFDAQKIEYGDVDAIANAGPTGQEFVNALVGVLTNDPSAISNPLGTDSGWGFGWEDIWVYKLGVNYDVNEKWSLRGGVNHGENPIDSDQNLFNILAPGVVKTHITAGFSHRPTKSSEWTVTYMHALEVDQDYEYSAANPLGGPDLTWDTEIRMYQHALEVQYSWLF